jgi:hypothetical protein
MLSTVREWSLQGGIPLRIDRNISSRLLGEIPRDSDTLNNDEHGVAIG